MTIRSMIEFIFTLYYFFRKSYPRKFSSRKELEQWQIKKLNKAFKSISKCVPYYSGKDTSSLTPMSKKVMMDNFKELNAIGISKDTAIKFAKDQENSREFEQRFRGYSIGLSSGTSGIQGIFLSSAKERSLWVGSVLSKVIKASLFKHQRIAFFLRANNSLYKAVNRFRINLKYFDLVEDFSTLTFQLEKYRPTILVAPPSVLSLLVDMRVTVDPEKIVSIAEVLEEVDRKKIEKYFKQTIHQVYQATEGFIASSCPFGTMHLNEDLMIIKKKWISKDQLRFHPVIFDFSRTTQPFLNYELDDVLVESKTRCPCGSIFTAIDRIEGRSQDVLYFSSYTGDLKPLFADYIHRWIIQYEEMDDYQVEQTDPNTIIITTKKNPNQKRLEEGLFQLCKLHKMRPPRLHIKSPSPQNLLNKLRRIKRTFYV